VRYVTAADFLRRYLVLRRFLQLSYTRSLRVEFEAARRAADRG
jgi:hypothetical protein